VLFYLFLSKKKKKKNQLICYRIFDEKHSFKDVDLFKMPRASVISLFSEDIGGAIYLTRVCVTFVILWKHTFF